MAPPFRRFPRPNIRSLPAPVSRYPGNLVPLLSASGLGKQRLLKLSNISKKSEHLLQWCLDYGVDYGVGTGRYLDEPYDKQDALARIVRNTRGGNAQLDWSVNVA